MGCACQLLIKKMMMMVVMCVQVNEMSATFHTAVLTS